MAVLHATLPYRDLDKGSEGNDMAELFDMKKGAIALAIIQKSVNANLLK
jgi:hypothetical protein